MIHVKRILSDPARICHVLIWAMCGFVFILLGSLSLAPLMGWDQLHFHYNVMKMKLWHILPYRDYYDLQFFGIYAYHWLSQLLFGYSHLGFRIFDLLNHLFLCATLYVTLPVIYPKIEKREIPIVLIFITAAYYGLGWWWNGQRESFLMPYVFWALFFWKHSISKDSIWYAILAGICGAIPFTIKPFYGIYIPLFVAITLFCNYPWPASRRSRIKQTLFAACGYLAVVFIMTIFLWQQEILSHFFHHITTYATGFKKISSPWQWIAFCILFHHSPAAAKRADSIYMLFYALHFFFACGYIGIISIRRQFRDAFALVFLFVVSTLLIFHQKNGEVINHHIPLVYLKMILSSLFITTVIDAGIRKILTRSENISTTMRGIATILAMAIFTYPLMRGTGFSRDLIIRSFKPGGIELCRTMFYPLKKEEDAIVRYINNDTSFDKNRDEILIFYYSLYIPFETRTKTFKRFPHIAPFLHFPKGTPLRRMLERDLISDLLSSPPKYIITQKDDTGWRTDTSFNHWTTSYDEMMSYPEIRHLVEVRYHRTIDMNSLVVYKRLK